MLSKKTIQAKQDARNLRKLSRRALKALDRTRRNLVRRGRGALEECEGWDGPDSADNDELHGRVASAAEELDACLDDVATRRALAHVREPGTKETGAQRHARKCERVGGFALKTLFRLQEALDEGEWRRAVSIAREGARALEQKLSVVGPVRRAERLDEPPPITEVPPTDLPESPIDSDEEAA